MNSRVDAARSVLLWAVAVLLLYGIDWRNLPIIGTADAGASSEVRFGLCVVGGIVAVFVLTFFWQILIQPAAMERELRDAMGREAEAAAARDAALRREVDALKADLASLDDAEAVLEELSRLHREGRALYDREADLDTWRQRLDDWNRQVETLIRDNFSISEVHRYRTAGSGGQFTTPWTFPGGDDPRSRILYTSRLMGLNDLLRAGSPLMMARLRQRHPRAAT